MRRRAYSIVASFPHASLLSRRSRDSDGTSMIAPFRFSPEERDCYSEDEISLKYLPRDHGYRYEMSNCLFESAFENILQQCKCFPGEQFLDW